MTITNFDLLGFIAWLKTEEKGAATISKYEAGVRDFVLWLNGNELTKDAAIAWKAHLEETGISAGTINGRLSALNSLLRYLNREDCRVRFLRVQRRIFRDPNRELTLLEYKRLREAARRSNDEQMYLVIETIGGTGIRVSELGYITVEAVRMGRVTVNLKGKLRTILFPAKLQRKLLKYIKKRKIHSGPCFVGKNGAPLNRKQVWARMKALCAEAGVAASKVFPHNLRHLFARTHYARYHDIVCLADMLGHSSVETTRIYLITTGEEYAQRLDALGLVS